MLLNKCSASTSTVFTTCGHHLNRLHKYTTQLCSHLLHRVYNTPFTRGLNNIISRLLGGRRKKKSILEKTEKIHYGANRKTSLPYQPPTQLCNTTLHPPSAPRIQHRLHKRAQQYYFQITRWEEEKIHSRANGKTSLLMEEPYSWYAPKSHLIYATVRHLLSISHLI